MSLSFIISHYCIAYIVLMCRAVKKLLTHSLRITDLKFAQHYSGSKVNMTRPLDTPTEVVGSVTMMV